MFKPLPSFLAKESLKLILFGGKGGTGKTTAAAATALYLAKARRDKKLLIVSTDPAHSLKDSFCCPIGSQITAIPSTGNLWALEINAERLLAEFMHKHDKVIRTLAHRGTYFDEEDIVDFFSLSLPGLDEVMTIIEVANILRSGRFDLIILDTAPTGHTIRLLAQPEQMEKWVEVFDLMQEKHRYISRHLTGKYVKDEADRFLEKMSEDLGRVRSLLQDSSTTEFVLIAVPESLSIYKTERLVNALQRYQIPARTILINRVAKEKDCPFCRARSRDGQRCIEELEEKFVDFQTIKIPLFPHEIRGLEDLEAFADTLIGNSPRWRTHSAPELKLEEPTVKVEGNLSVLIESPLEFVLFGGKGGVGKTSIAAATGLYLARKLPDKKILVFSTDPAHSLSDSFGYTIGNRITSIPTQGNLYALEIDATQLLEDFKRRYREDIGRIFDKFLDRGVDIKFDREVVSDLIDLSPPGLDEIMAMSQIVVFSQRREYDLFILDTAPAGHLLRFLELPDIAKKWLEYFLRLLIKYKGVVRLAQAAERLIDLTRNVRIIHEKLTDSQKTEFIAIAIPEAMGVLETERLLQRLQRLKVPCHHVLVNMVIPPTDCSFCSQQGNDQQRYIAQLGQLGASGYHVSQFPMFPHELKGLDHLAEMAEILFAK